MRKKDEALRGLLLDKAREIMENGGADELTMRRLAVRAGVASGTVYNYFENKEGVLLALTESYWQNAVRELKSILRPGRFTEQIRQAFTFLNERVGDEGGVLMASLSSARAAGQERMRGMQTAVQAELAARLAQDTAIHTGVWTETFTREAFAGFVLENLLCRMQGGQEEIGFFLEAVERILYGGEAE